MNKKLTDCSIIYHIQQKQDNGEFKKLPTNYLNPTIAHKERIKIEEQELKPCLVVGSYIF